MAILLVFFSVWWLSLNFTTGDEPFIIKWTSLIKKKLLGSDHKMNPDELLLVDISQAKAVIPIDNQFGEPSPYFREVVTDRAMLAEFLDMIGQAGAIPKLVVLDVQLAAPTPDDSLLLANIQAMGDRFLGVGWVEEDGTVQKPVLDIPYAMASYKATGGLFLKYPLFVCDSLITLPARMAELTMDAPIEPGRFWDYIDGAPALKNPIIDFKIRLADIRQPQQEEPGGTYSIFSIGTILESRDFMEEADLKAYFDNKIVLVGDFVNDEHWTSFNVLSGPLIILNAYSTLIDGDAKIQWPWLIFLLAGFWILMYRIFEEVKVEKPEFLVRLLQSDLGRALLNALDEAFILIMISIFSYFLFNIHINILILLFLVKTFEYLMFKGVPWIIKKWH